MIIIGGKNQYALDGASGIAFYLRYHKENGTYPVNVMWSILPFFGQGQGLERSIRSIMRFSLALQTMGPVIFTEVRQHCCGNTGASCNNANCDDHDHGDHYVYNIINMCEQYDISWVGWGWRGNNDNAGYVPCVDGETVCSVSDMRSAGGLLTNGSLGGANWRMIWRQYVATKNINVADVDPGKIAPTDPQPQGFLPRPCIVGDFGIGKMCGYDLNINVENLKYNVFASQELNAATLPGLPPLGSCNEQGCDGYNCTLQAGVCPKTFY
jgi:hypothetical protein